MSWLSKWQISMALLGTALLAFRVSGQPLPQQLPPAFNVQQIPNRKAPEDPDRKDFWTLDFSFKSPRTIELDIPGRGRRIVWYLWFQLSNDTGEARTLVPEFLWVVVTPGREGAYRDEVLSKEVINKIRSVEDPQQIYPIHTTVSLLEVPIPHVKQFDEAGKRIAYPEYVTGVATWIVATPEEIKTLSKQPRYVRNFVPPDTRDFYIYVFGLSNAFVMVDGPDGRPITKNKALRLKFKRRGDEFRQHPDQIQYLGYDWVYVERHLSVPPGKPTGQPAKAP